MHENDIAIVGMGLHVPGANSPAKFWQNLQNGVESVTTLTEQELLEAGVCQQELLNPNYVSGGAFLDEVASFDPAFFGISPKEAAIMDPQHRHFLEVCWEALESAGHSPTTSENSIGVFGGCGMGKYMYQNVLRNQSLLESVGYFLLRHTGNDKDFLTTRVSYALNLQGPSVGIQTACSTSLVAVHVAAQSLLAGECDIALAGGVTIEIPQRVGYVYVENEILSPDGHCRAFDHRAMGTIFGSGAGAVALRRMEDATADGDHIYAVIKGSAVNNDGSAKVGYLAPSVDGQAAAIIEALDIAEVSSDTIGYIEAHGTGTPMGDPIEVEALTQAFRISTQACGYCGIGSVKTNIGHLDTAAGVVSLIKTALSLENKKIPPSLNWEAPNPAIAFETTPFFVNHSLKDWPRLDAPRRAGVNSLGVGGTNAHVILEEAPAPADRKSDDSSTHPVLLGFSAKNAEALDGYSRKLATFISENPKAKITDVAYSLNRSRQEFSHRRVLACRSLEEAASLLESIDTHRVHTHIRQATSPPLIFMLPGGGAQYLGMGAGLHRSELLFQKEINRCITILKESEGTDLSPYLFATNRADPSLIKSFEQPSIQLPAIFAVEYALAKLWISKGLSPDAFIGHSMGENTAACLSGVFSLEAALKLVSLRGRLFEKLPAGGMLSVLLPTEDIRPLLFSDLVLAVHNAPEMNVVSGPINQIESFAKQLQSQDIEFSKIPINVAAHSPMLEPILNEFRQYLESIKLTSPEVPFISNRTGDWITADQATDSEYWTDHLRNAVKFSSGMDTVLSEFTEAVLIEVGPGSALISIAKMQPRFCENHHVISSLRHRDLDVDDEIFFLTALGQAWASGYEVKSLVPEGPSNFITLPTYAFQHSEYWVSPTNNAPLLTSNTIERQESIENWFSVPAWQLKPILNPGNFNPHTWLIFVDEIGIGDSCASKLREHGQLVVVVRNGERNQKINREEYIIDSDRGEEGYQLLVSNLTEDDIVVDRILHLWMLTTAELFRTRLNRFAHNLERSFYSLYHLIRAFGERDALANVHLIAASNGARQVFDEPISSPEKATHDGICMVSPKEYPGLTCRSIDIDYEGDVSKNKLPFNLNKTKQHSFVRLLMNEMSDEATSGRFAYRENQRYELFYRAVDYRNSYDSVSNTRISIRDKGVYLITGGLGGLALTIAESLALSKEVTILLICRSGLISRDQWDQWIDKHSIDDKISKTILQIKRLELLGAKIEICSIDITDHELLAAFVDDAEKRVGAINGVIHAAGVVDDDLLALKSTEKVESVFAPKIYGTLVLDMIFQNRATDFMILFSSSSTITAPLGQTDYVAANAYMNAYADSKSSIPNQSTIALNWGVWNEVGIAAESTGNVSDGYFTTTHPLLGKKRKIRGGAIYESVPLSTETHWVLDEHRLADGRALIPGTLSIDLAYFTSCDVLGKKSVEIRDLTLISPMPAADGGFIRSRAKVTAKGNNQSFLLQSLQTDVNGGLGWMTHAEASLLERKIDGANALQIDEIKNRCSAINRVNYEKGLKTAQDSHLKFGQRWNVLREQGFGQNEAYAILELASEFVHHDRGYKLHPALLDIATGFGMELVNGYTTEESSLWVPASYKRIVVYAELENYLFSWVKSSPNNSTDNNSVSFDIVLADREGHVVLEIQEFIMQKAPPGDLLASLNRIPSESLENIIHYSTTPSDQAKEFSASEKLLRDSVSQGIRPIEGMQVFRQLMYICDRGQIVVSALELDALMQLSTTQLNIKNSEEIVFERPQLTTEFCKPNNKTEQDLVEMWRELLGIDAIGINDNFFDLGGHSLIAVRLVAKIKAFWDISLPVSVLVEFPTIAKLASKLPADLIKESPEGQPHQNTNSRKPDKWSSLVPLKKGDAKSPFFCVAGKGGNPLNLRHLAKFIESDQPLYGIQHRGVDGLLPTHTSIKTMAAECIKDIREVQNNGPYLLGGFSGGGLVAFEMAMQLHQSGDEIALLVLFDTPSPTRLSRSLFDRTKLHLQQFRQFGIKYIRDKALERLGSLRNTEPAGSTNISVTTDNDTPPHIAVGNAWDHMESNYAVSSYDGNAILFRPYLSNTSEVDVFLNEDRFNGWKNFFLRGMEVVELPGGHSTMFEEPHVRVLARRLNRIISDSVT